MTSVCLLIDGDSLRGWEVNSLRHLIENTDCNIKCVIQNAAGSSLVSQFRTALEMGSWGVVVGGLETYWTLREYPQERSKYHIDNLKYIQDTERLRCEPSEYDGFGNTLPNKAIELLSSVDVAIRFGFGVIKGKALTAPKFGMLSFHHGDIRKYRGRPAGFWEYMNGDSTAGVTLQRLSEKLDGGKIIEFTQVDISDTSSWLEVRRRLYQASEPMLANGIKKIVSGEGLILDPDELGRLYTAPDFHTTIRYLISEI